MTRSTKSLVRDQNFKNRCRRLVKMTYHMLTTTGSMTDMVLLLGKNEVTVW